MISKDIFNNTYPIKKLGEVVIFLDSKRKPVKESERVTGIYPYYGANGLQGWINDYIFDDELILLAEDGGHFNNPDRGVAYKITGKTWVNNHAHVIKPLEDLNIDYLCRVLENYDLRTWITGTTRAKLTKGGASEILIPLPPLTEQKRIAQILDKADELRQKRQQSIEKLDELLQATFIDMFGDPVTNPKGWDLVKLSTIAEYFNGLTYKPENVVNNGTIVLRSSNIQNSGLDFNDIVRVNAKIKDKIFVKDNDILMCSRNGSAKLVGKVALIKNLNEPMTFGAFMMIIRSNEKYANYLLNYFKTLAFRRQISTGATTTINQITGAMLDRISLPLPNDMALNQFTEIAKSIETQKQRLEKQLTAQENLFKSLQQRAFNGEL